MEKLKMKNEKPIYRLVDCRGRVYIPKEFRTAAEIDSGDIVKFSLNKGTLSIKRVHIIEIGDKSTEAVEVYVLAAIKNMSNDKQLSIAAHLLELVEQSKEEEK